MGIEIQVTPRPIVAGGQAVFSFNNPVQNFAVGLAGFAIQYPINTDHWVQQFSINLENNLTTNGTTHLVTTTAHSVLQDSNGHTIGPLSVLWLVCVAQTGNKDNSTIVGVLPGIQVGTPQNLTLPSPSGGNTNACVFLSGFQIKFSDGDHQVLARLSAAVSTLTRTRRRSRRAQA